MERAARKAPLVYSSFMSLLMSGLDLEA